MKNKKLSGLKKVGLLFLLFLVIISISGCGHDLPDYITGEVMMIEPEPEPDSDWHYEDEFISFQFKPFLRANDRTAGYLEGVALEFENYSDEAVQIVWNSAVFVDIDGSTSDLAGLDGEISYSDMEGNIPKTTIDAQSEREIFLVPTDTIYYQDGWEREPIFKVTKDNITDIDGSTFEIVLPVRITEEVKEYQFVFESNVYLIE